MEISAESTFVEPVADETLNEAPVNPKAEPIPKKPVPYVRVYEDYEHLRREANSL
jgi:hypothetical protein